MAVNVLNIDRQLIDDEDTLLYLSRGDKGSRTDSKIIAVQVQMLQATCHATEVKKKKANADCFSKTSK